MLYRGVRIRVRVLGIGVLGVLGFRAFRVEGFKALQSSGLFFQDCGSFRVCKHL